MELARIVVYAKWQGWLSDVRDVAMLAVISRLEAMLSAQGRLVERELKRELSQQVRECVDTLFEHIEAQFSHESIDGEMPEVLRPNPVDMQQKIILLFEMLAERVLEDLFEREAAALWDAGDFVNLGEGWPHALRQAAQRVVDIVEGEALNIELAEEELWGPKSRRPRRKLFAPAQQEPEWAPEPPSVDA
jgi:hypothetical protein